MRITGYRFGRIEVDGRRYDDDLIVTPEGVVENWRRSEGHRLAVADLAEVMAAKPEIVVVGTGYFGRMRVAEETRRYLKAQGVALHAARTADAVETFDRLQKESARIVAALHLSC
jgi:hypothetical protein